MLTTPHVLVGLTILKIIPNPGLAFILAFLSHFLLDFFIPHWNPHIYTEMKKNKRLSLNSLKIILLDGFLSLTILAYLSWQIWPDFSRIINIGLIAFASVLGDLIEIPYYFFGLKNKYLMKYVEFEHQHQSNGTFFWGVITQILVILACLKQLFF